LRPAGPSELHEDWTAFFGDLEFRCEIQTIMALLKCEAWQAVVVRQTSRMSALLYEQDERDEEDTWKRPKTEEDPDD
jgi:hypothetical protein